VNSASAIATAKATQIAPPTPADLTDQRVDARSEHVAEDEQQQHVAGDRPLERRVV